MSSGGGQTQQTQQQQSNTGSTSSTSQFTPHPSTLPGYGFMAGNTTNLMQKPVGYFPGRGYVGPSGPTTSGVNSIMGGANAMQPFLNTMGENYGFLSNAADVANNPYVQDQISANERSVNKQLSEEMLPQVRDQGIAVNALGSGRQGLREGQAIGDAQEALMNQNASTMLNAYGQGLGAQQNALGQTGNMLQNLLAPGQAQLGAGGVVEDYQNRALQDAMNRYNFQFSEPNQRMDQLGQRLGFMRPLGSQYKGGTDSSLDNSTRTSPNPNYRSGMQNAMGLGSMAGGLWDTWQNRQGQGGGTTIGSSGGRPLGGFGY